ncbi:MAG: HAD-IB family hydrolase [Gammaproteobacteria bacterium]
MNHPVQKNIVLFDMDHTLVSANTIELWNAFLDQKGTLTPEECQQWRQFHVDYVNGQLDILASYSFELMIAKKIPLAIRALWLQEFFTDWVKDKISPIGLQLINTYKQQPETIVVLITATLAFIAAPVATYAAVDDLIATEPEIIAGDLSGKLLGIPSIGEGKLKRFQHWLQQKGYTPKHTILYSDSINDLPLLSEVDQAILVDPDHQLQQIGQQKNWPIMSFKVRESIESQ